MPTEPIKETVMEPVTEPTTEPTQVPTEPVTPPTPQEPKAGAEPNIIELLSTVDKGVLLKSEAIQTLLETARQQEKNKLYSTVEKKDNTIKQLNDTIVDLQSQLKSKEELTMEGEKVLLEQIQAMKESQDKLIKEMEEEKKKARKAELETYKTKKVNEANGELITDLVGGNSEEEIDASIEKAKARYIEIVSPYKSKVEELETQSIKPNRAHAPKPSDPSTPPAMEFTADDIKKMSKEEYAKYRQTLLGMAKG